MIAALAAVVQHRS